MPPAAACSKHSSPCIRRLSLACCRLLLLLLHLLLLRSQLLLQCRHLLLGLLDLLLCYLQQLLLCQNLKATLMHLAAQPADLLLQLLLVLDCPLSFSLCVDSKPVTSSDPLAMHQRPYLVPLTDTHTARP